MSNDIWTVWATGATVYALIKNYENEFWYPTGENFETWGTGTRTSIDYAVPLTEIVAGLGDYSADWPSGMSAGKYLAYIKLQAGDTPLITDLSIAGPAKNTGQASSRPRNRKLTLSISVTGLWQS